MDSRTDTGNVKLGYKDPEIPWMYSAPRDFYSDFVSGQQRLPNGNTLIAEGMTVRIFELETGSDRIVWEYINPVIHGGPPFGPPVSVRLENTVFRSLRYRIDRFSDKHLSPVGPIELGITARIPDTGFVISPGYPNPFRDQAIISMQVDRSMHIEVAVFNVLGQKVTILINEFHAVGAYNYIFNAEALPPGIYLCRAVSENASVTATLIHH